MSKISRNLLMVCALICLTLGVVSQSYAEQQCYFNIPENTEASKVFGENMPVRQGPFPSMEACEDSRDAVHSDDRWIELTECECSGSDVPDNTPYSGDPQVMMAQMMGKVLGMMLQQGLESLSNSNQQQAEYQQAQVELHREEERARIRAALERQRKFEASMRNMVDIDMKGPRPDDGDMQFKGGAVVSTGELSFKNDNSGLFGESNGGSGTLSFKTYNGPTYTPHTALQQLEAASCLSQTAAQPGMTTEEAKNAANQAGVAMPGGTVSADMSGCAPPPPPAPAAPPPLTQDQVTLYTKLLDVTNQEQQQAVQYQQKLQALQQKLAQDKQDVTAKQQAVEQLQNQPPGPSTEAGTPSPQPPSNALAEAEAALQQAQQAEDGDNQTLSQAQQQMNQLDQKIKTSQNCLNQAQADPSKAGSLISQCSE